MSLKSGNFLARSTSRYFRTNYAADYKTFIIHHIASDPQSPLSKRMRQEYARRKKEGLWWHATTGTELSKYSVVRTWCRRRLHNAFAENLKQRGFDEYGRLVNADALKEKHRDLVELLSRKGGAESFALTGSFRFHALEPCLIAKYVHLRDDFAALIDRMLEARCDELKPSRYMQIPLINDIGARRSVGDKYKQTLMSAESGSRGQQEYTPRRTLQKHALPQEREKTPSGTKKTSPASTRISRRKT